MHKFETVFGIFGKHYLELNCDFISSNCVICKTNVIVHNNQLCCISPEVHTINIYAKQKQPGPVKKGAAK